MADIHSPEIEALRFEPEEGVVVAEPTGSGYGHWAGGAKATFDEESGLFYLYYRQRTPIEAGRGGECFIAVSEDGLNFREVWSAARDQFVANSIEVGCPVRDPSGEWRLYISYEFAQGNYWRIDVLRGPSLDKLDVRGRRTVAIPHDMGLHMVKDPVIYVRDGKYYGYFCVTPQRVFERDKTGASRRVVGHDATALYVSEDGLHFPEMRYVFEPRGHGWDAARARVNCLIPLTDGGYVATYDGGTTIYDNYEEMCGLAYSHDGESFERLTEDGPWVASRHGGVRYVYGLRVGNEVYFYYEYTREDLGHELRAVKVELS